jgi:hypothetical protein
LHSARVKPGHDRATAAINSATKRAKPSLLLLLLVLLLLPVSNGAPSKANAGGGDA